MGARSILAAVAALVAGAVALVAAQAQIARRRPYLDDPEFEVDHRIDGSEPVIELVVLGDSTVAGVGVDAVADTLPIQIADRVAASTGRAVHVIGRGVSGARAVDVLDHQLGTIGSADALVVEIGSNDVVHGTPVASLERTLEQLLLQARAKVDVVVLGGSGRMDTPNFHPPLRHLVAWRARVVRRLQAQVARRTNTGFVDIGGAVADRFTQTLGHTSSDGFHPAAAGYGVWADALAERVVQLLARVDPDTLRAGASGERLD